MTEEVTILFVDDNIRTRETVLRELKKYNITAIGQASNGVECLQQLLTIIPDVILLDLEMPVMDGNETFDKIKERYPFAKILILSQFDNSGMTGNYYERGANGYLSKKFIVDNFDKLAEGIRVIKNSKKFYYYGYDPETAIKYSNREIEAITHLFECKTSKEIGVELGIQEGSVKKLRHKLYRKTKSRNAAEFLKYCLNSGLKFLGKKQTRHGIRKRNKK